MDDQLDGDEAVHALRAAVGRLEVRRTEVGAVEHRGRRRRRTRRGLVASFAAAVAVLGGLAMAGAIDGDAAREQVTTATTTEAPSDESVPQPLLSRPVRSVAGSYVLDELTPSGPRAWWTHSGGGQPTHGVVLADGRRFGLVVEEARVDGVAPTATLVELDPSGREVGSRRVALDAGERSSGISLVGAVGDEVVLERSLEALGEPSDDGSRPILTSTTVSALDVDAGTERTLVADAQRGLSSAAGGVLARATGVDCTLSVQDTVGPSEPRTLVGGCAGEVEGLAGMAFAIDVSPDGRYGAVVWGTLRTTGPTEARFEVLDLRSGEVVVGADLQGGFSAPLAWTGLREISVAVPPDVAAGLAGLGGSAVQVEVVEALEAS